MSYISLERAKAHLNVFVGDDDQHIAFLIDAAESYRAKWLQRPLSDLLRDTTGDSVPDLDRTLDPAVELGILTDIAFSYENRGDGQLQFKPSRDADDFLHLYRTNLGV
jgi:hypothetical protein